MYVYFEGGIDNMIMTQIEWFQSSPCKYIDILSYGCLKESVNTDIDRADNDGLNLVLLNREINYHMDALKESIDTDVNKINNDGSNLIL